MINGFEIPRTTIQNIDGEVVKENERYVVQDNTTLENLTLSSTILHENNSTTGHRHSDLEEIYTFIAGDGEMQLDDCVFPVQPGDVVFVKKNVFHKVTNISADEKLYFVCVFNGKRTY